MKNFKSLTRAIKRGHIKHEESGLYKGNSTLLRKTRNGFWVSIGTMMPTWFISQFVPHVKQFERKPKAY